MIFWKKRDVGERKHHILNSLILAHVLSCGGNLYMICGLLNPTIILSKK